MRLFLLLFTVFFSLLKASAQVNKHLIIEKFDSTKYMVFHVTGDGGWKGFDVKLTKEFRTHKMSYIVLNSLRYFWTRKTPEQFAKDMIPIIEHYFRAWDKKVLVLVGLSFGAEVIPFLYNRLPDDLKSKVAEVVLITPSGSSDFAIHITDMMEVKHTYKYNVVKEVEKISSPKVLAFFGKKERSSFPADHKQSNYQVQFVKGGHRFTDSYLVINAIIKGLR